MPTLNLIIGIFCAMLVAMVLLGGIKRIGSVSEKLVPFMALFYVVLGIGVVLLNVQRLPGVLWARVRLPTPAPTRRSPSRRACSASSRCLRTRLSSAR